MTKKKSTKPQMCLNMIVKNEAHIIKETLDSIIKYIDYWVICDTGSTDGTQDLIKAYFKERNIDGILVNHEWKNFGYNRTMAFKEAFNRSDYVWVIDADDLIIGNFRLPSIMNADLYLLKYGSPDQQNKKKTNLTYYRAQIFRNTLKWEYKGILHEFAVCVEPNYKHTTDKMEGDYFIDSRRLGDRSKDPLKYLKDANLLVEEIENNPKSELIGRNCFYAGQSFRDANDSVNSIKYYKKRIECGGWIEEIYISYMEIGNAMIKLNYDKKDIVEAFINGFKTIPGRAECLYYLSLYHIHKNDIVSAYKACKIASTIKNPVNFVLFVKNDIHLYRCKELLYKIYMTIKAENINIDIKEEDIKKIYNFLTNDSNVPNDVKDMIKNYKHPKPLKKIKMCKNYVVVDNIDSIGHDIGCFPDMTIDELSDIADLYEDCIGFNSWGYLKSKICVPMRMLNNRVYKNDGIFIKNDIADSILAEYKDTLLTTTDNKTWDISNINDVKNVKKQDVITQDECEKEDVEHASLKMDDEIKNMDSMFIMDAKEVNNDFNNMLGGLRKNDVDKKMELDKKIEDINISMMTNRDKEKRITFTVTTCKRHDLFTKTMNSFIEKCLDVNIIDEWIVIDDNSDKEDIKKMMLQYPFIKMIIKNEEQKGHMESMNMLIDSVKTEYMVHLEDDWLFEKEFCIEEMVSVLKMDIKEILGVEDIPKDRDIYTKKIGQVLFNRNYTELPENVVQGGFPIKVGGKEYLIHEHYNPDVEKDLYIRSAMKYQKSSTYWPHYSLQPSVLTTEIFKTVGHFTDNDGFFERNFADRYYKNNYVSCFKNDVTCRHIGKLLCQRNDPNILNAYEMNNISQFTKNKKFEGWTFYKNKDIRGQDLNIVNNGLHQNVDTLFEIAKNNTMCTAFNTWGYYKGDVINKQNLMHLPNRYSNSDGIYIKNS